ncbi:MAG: DNA methylase, partial [Proteobacteria bacterium]|nr:DNA methylase [Pseudomonadota bacterium]
MALLEGLEVKVKFISASLKNKDFRIDSQFYTKELYKNPNLNYEKIGNLLLKAQYGISISMNEDKKGYPIYRMNEIHNMLCDTDVLKHANISNEELKTFTLNDRDVVFNRTNSFEWVGRTGIYKKLDNRPFIFASYLVRFITNQEKLLPEYLTAFLNCKYGVWDIKRRARQSINQTNVNPEEVKEIEIPKLSINIQNSIKDLFDNAHLNRVKAKQTYAQAEKLLLAEIGLQDFKPCNDAVNIKSFQDSFASCGRLDAEYYQKKYDDYLSLIRKYSNGADPINIICQHKGKNYKPNEFIEYKYIELSNIGKSGDINGCTIDLGGSLPSRARRKVETGDVIISSIEGSLDSCALVTKQYDGALCSTGFYIINSETLLVLFKSSLMQNIL